MDYPLYINGIESGALRVTREGLLTRFDADCPDMGKIIRLCIFGGGKSAYLGVMAPKGGRMALSKSFSRSAMSAFPEKIEYAADAELTKKAEEKEDFLLWISSPAGVLYANDGTQSLVALPADGAHIRTRRILRRINGRDYAIFPGKKRRI